jgi:hypothetical protein
MIHVLLGPASFDDRIADYSNCLYWKDDLSVGPVPMQETLPALSCIRERFWNAPTPLNRLFVADREQSFRLLATEAARTKAAKLADATDRSLKDRDERIYQFDTAEEPVVWFASNRREVLMLLALVRFLDPTLLRQSSIVRCAKCGPQSYGANQLAEFFDSRRSIGEDFVRLAHEAWMSYTAVEPTELNNLALRLRREPNLLIGNVLSWTIEEYPSVHNGLSQVEEELLRQVGDGDSVAGIIGRTMSYTEHCLGDRCLLQGMWDLAEAALPALEFVDGTTLSMLETVRSFTQSRVRLTSFGSQLLSGAVDFVKENGVDRWIGGVRLNGRSLPWRYDTHTKKLAAL